MFRQTGLRAPPWFPEACLAPRPRQTPLWFLGPPRAHGLWGPRQLRTPVVLRLPRAPRLGPGARATHHTTLARDFQRSPVVSRSPQGTHTPYAPSPLGAPRAPIYLLRCRALQPRARRPREAPEGPERSRRPRETPEGPERARRPREAPGKPREAPEGPERPRRPTGGLGSVRKAQRPRRPREAPGRPWEAWRRVPGRPREAPGCPERARRPREAPGGPEEPREAPGGPRRTQRAPGGPEGPRDAPEGLERARRPRKAPEGPERAGRLGRPRGAV